MSAQTTLSMIPSIDGVLSGADQNTYEDHLLTMPSFAIEVAGEVNPLVRETLYKALVASTSNDQQQLQTGTRQLEHWARTPGFYSSLQSLFIDYDIPSEIRHLAIIHLKNGVDKQWRKASRNAISKHEKDLIRSRSLGSVLNEPHSNLALSSAIFVARVIRIEYLTRVNYFRPDAIPSILTSLQKTCEKNLDEDLIVRHLLILLMVIKEYTNARIRSTQQILHGAAPAITQTVFTIYSSLQERWLSYFRGNGGDEASVYEALPPSLLAIRTLRRIIVIGFEAPHRDPYVVHVSSSLASMLEAVLDRLTQGSMQQSLGIQSKMMWFLEKHIIQVAKFHLNMAKERPSSFVLLPQSIGLARAYWAFARQFSETYGKGKKSDLVIGTDGDAEDEDQICFSERFALKSLLLLRACVKMVFNPAMTFKLQTEENKKDKKDAVKIMSDEMLTLDFAKEVIDVMVSKFFIFTPRDLKQWETEPDEWEKSQEGAGEDWEFSIRTCAEKLFLEMVINYKAELVPVLTAFIHNAAISSYSHGDIFYKDSVYAALGLAAPVLHDNFDFSGFLSSRLAPEVQSEGPDCNILRRRIAIVLGQWLPAKEGLDRPLVYKIIQHLLNANDKNNDQVVRVTAGRQLGNIVDPFDFNASDFVPFAPVIIERLLDLAKEVDLAETRQALLNSLHILVVKLEASVVLFGDQILTGLSTFWAGSEGDISLREMILSVLVALLGSMGEHARTHHISLIPLIQASTNPETPEGEILAEEALNLWSAILDQTPSPAPHEVIELFRYLMPSLEVGSEMLARGLTILATYIHLIPMEIIGHSSELFAKCDKILKGPLQDPVGLVAHAIELLFCFAEKLGDRSTVEQVTLSMVATPFLTTVLDDLHDAYQAHQTTGPNKKYPTVSSIIETDYFAMLSRIAILSPTILTSAVRSVRPDESYEWLIEEWFSHLDSISHPLRKKLSCLALTSFLNIDAPEISGRLQLYMAMWTSVLIELEEEYEGKDGTVVKRDCLVHTEDDTFKPDQFDSPSVIRSKELSQHDPIHTVETRTFIRTALEHAIQSSGGMDIFRTKYIDNVDADIVKAFAELGVI
ncbi:uncharacterized protein KY384_001353 [Bacidia gigantensis]|uniref:uncharacterized protein n=1 Tax=Bacidia gigantensis TaxID=2732470 RepID=UPI001D055745|nr:uncharacterized protein KY384_001353 [Bacidia gigantensis]KAG8533613.1 hypothetical protein KY384_001353 [Bacidia gigantensis]